MSIAIQEMDELLVNCIREHSSLHYAKEYSESDEIIWDKIAKEIGIQSEISNLL